MNFHFNVQNQRLIFSKRKNLGNFLRVTLDVFANQATV